MQERQLYTLWQALARTGRFVADGHHRLRVFEAGRLNLTFGPDFSGAQFELDGVRMFGDVEMHVEQSDWYRHRHHLDPFYQNVALHVVLRSPQEPAWVHSAVNKRAIPSFCLTEDLVPRAVAHPGRSCKPPTEPGVDAIAVLQSLALARLKSKIRIFQQELDTASIEQVFYASLLRTLGYPANADAFQQLAQKLPFSWMSKNLFHPLLPFDRLYALYAGQAGFLEIKGSADRYVKQLQSIYNEFRSLLPADNLSMAQWRFSGLRPFNHPHFRLAGWVAFYLKTQGQPFRRLQVLFFQRLPYPDLLSKLQACFQIRTQGYWARHYRLASSLRTGARYYFGRARLLEMVVNTLIPLFSALALRRQSEGFYSYLENFYLSLPPVTAYQGLARNFPWWAQYFRLWPRHAFWQGLLQLDAEYCRVSACSSCPLRHRLDKNGVFD